MPAPIEVMVVELQKVHANAEGQAFVQRTYKMSSISCFVVSPIGNKESDSRKNADDVFELIIQPALEKFDISVTRADKISSVGSITSEVISMVQGADLCIIDITGHNPNVMYECGRRHETGKPYIMIAREGETLPFDITTIRTIFYDLTKPREIRNVVIAIQEILKKLVQQGFSTSNAGDSLASMSEAVRRIERTLNALVTTPTISASGNVVSSSAGEILKKLQPADAIIYAFNQRDPQLLDELLPRVRSRIESNSFLTSVLPRAAALGSRIALDMLRPVLPTLDQYPVQDQKYIVGGYLTGMALQDREEQGLKELDELFTAVSKGERPTKATAQDRAYFLNQKQRLLAGLNRSQEAIVLGEQVLALMPDDSTYIYNQCLNYEHVKDDKKCVQLADRLMANLLEEKDGVPDEDHLELVIRTYARVGVIEKARDALRILQQHHPLKASLVTDREEFARQMQQH